MSRRPKGWLAALLGFFVSPLGLLYVGRWKWAIASAVGLLGVAAFQLAFADTLVWLTLPVQLVFICTVSRIAYLQAIRFEPDRVRPAYSRGYWLWTIFLMFVLLAITFRAFFFEPFRAPAGSMLPTLKPGARFLVQKWGYGNYGTYGFILMRSPATASIDRGDILAFELPTKRSLHYIKRIMGLPGDKIEYRNKVLFINGQEIKRHAAEDYLDESAMRYHSQYIEKLDNNKEYAVLLDKDRPAAVLNPYTFPHSQNCAYGNEGVVCVVPDGHYYALGDHRDNSLDSRYWGFVPRDHMVGKLVHVFSQP
ncbi:MAG: signal peptidase I [Pseudomonadota bacterium]